MVHVGNPDHPATQATCEAVSDAQAAYLHTLGWERVIEVPDEPQPMIVDTANGLEHDTALLVELAGLDADQLAQVAAFAAATAEIDQTVRDAPSRRSRTGSTPQEG